MLFLFAFTVKTKLHNSCKSCPLNSFHISHTIGFHISKDVKLSQLIQAVIDLLVLCKGIYILGRTREHRDAGAEAKTVLKY